MKTGMQTNKHLYFCYMGLKNSCAILMLLHKMKRAINVYNLHQPKLSICMLLWPKIFHVLANTIPHIIDPYICYFLNMAFFQLCHHPTFVAMISVCNLMTLTFKFYLKCIFIDLLFLIYMSSQTVFLYKSDLPLADCRML